MDTYCCRPPAIPDQCDYSLVSNVSCKNGVHYFVVLQTLFVTDYRPSVVSRDPYWQSKHCCAIVSISV